MWCVYRRNGVLERKPVRCDNTGKPGGCFTKWNKPGTKDKYYMTSYVESKANLTHESWE